MHLGLSPWLLGICFSRLCFREVADLCRLSSVWLLYVILICFSAANAFALSDVQCRGFLAKKPESAFAGVSTIHPSVKSDSMMPQPASHRGVLLLLEEQCALFLQSLGCI